MEQLHKIFKLCGTPSADYWKKLKLSTTFRPPHSYKPNLHEVFRDYPRSALGLLTVLLALDPAYRGSASSALQHEVRMIPKPYVGNEMNSLKLKTIDVITVVFSYKPVGM